MSLSGKQLERFEAHSDELIEEFHRHRDDFIDKNPDLNDERKIFEGWAIQKIAGLQILALDMLQRLEEVERRIR